MENEEIGTYTIKHPIDSGGMADVYYAENKLNRPAAIKILKKKYCDDPSVRDCFIQEARIMVDLIHPNICKFMTLETVKDQPAIIMEYLDGQSFRTLIGQREKLSSEKIKVYFNQSCEALRYTHSRNVIHRDIKPSNIFITRTNEVKLMDFGIAKTQEGKGHTLTGQT
ncbi:MAG: serine/threonine-protein kinase [Gelidibacter sp.]